MKLYVSDPPWWWPYLLHVSGSTIRVGHASVVVDNGAYTYYRSGRWPGSIELWAARVLRDAHRYAVHGCEAWLVVPDHPRSPFVSAEWARTSSRILRRAGGRVKLILPIHFRDYSSRSIEESFKLYRPVISLLEPDALAAPARLTCGRDTACMLKIVYAVRELADETGVPTVHVLGSSLSPGFLRRIMDAVQSIDTMAWTRRPTKSFGDAVGMAVRRSDTSSVFLAAWLYYLHVKGVDIEDWEQALPHLPKKVMDAIS